jgi:hypothetical protein
MYGRGFTYVCVRGGLAEYMDLWVPSQLYNFSCLVIFLYILMWIKHYMFKLSFLCTRECATL